MKRSIKHIPKEKQEELKEIVAYITGKYTFEMIILFGSYARGDWVNDKYIENGITYEYTSDYDLLILVETEEESLRIEKSCNLKRKLKRELEIATPINIIYHGIDYMNEEIENWNYFFNDILKEGIRLYHSGKFVFSRPKQLFPIQRKAKAQKHFDSWFKDATMSFNGFVFFCKQGQFDTDYFKKAIFELHQTAEKYYMAVLLVFTDYKPKTHDLEELGNKAGKQNAEFKSVFPQQTANEKRMYIKLKKAYIDSRYKLDYVVTKEELEYLSSRIEKLGILTKRICEKRIEEIGKE